MYIGSSCHPKIDFRLILGWTLDSFRNGVSVHIPGLQAKNGDRLSSLSYHPCPGVQVSVSSKALQAPDCQWNLLHQRVATSPARFPLRKMEGLSVGEVSQYLLQATCHYWLYWIPQQLLMWDHPDSKTVLFLWAEINSSPTVWIVPLWKDSFCLGSRIWVTMFTSQVMASPKP